MVSFKTTCSTSLAFRHLNHDDNFSLDVLEGSLHVLRLNEIPLRDDGCLGIVRPVRTVASLRELELRKHRAESSTVVEALRGNSLLSLAKGKMKMFTASFAYPATTSLGFPKLWSWSPIVMRLRSFMPRTFSWHQRVMTTGNSA